MGRSAGTGSPLWFMCPKLRAIYPRMHWHWDQHKTTPTGRHKAGPKKRTGSIRRIGRALEFRCACGHVGWSTHVDLAVQAVELGKVKPEEIADSEFELARLRREATQ